MKGVAFDPEEASSTEVGYRELQQAIATLAQVDAQQAELTVRAPFSGIVTDVPPTLRLGETGLDISLTRRFTEPAPERA